MSRQLPDSIHWQIYQAYLSGPHALFRLFKEACGRHALDGPPDPDRQQSQIDDLSARIARLYAQVEKLRAEVGQLRGRNFQLGRRNAELEALSTNDHASWYSFEKLIFAVRSAFRAANLVSVSGSSGNRYIFVRGSLPTTMLPR